MPESPITQWNTQKGQFRPSISLLSPASVKPYSELSFWDWSLQKCLQPFDLVASAPSSPRTTASSARKSPLLLPNHHPPPLQSLPSINLRLTSRSYLLLLSLMAKIHLLFLCRRLRPPRSHGTSSSSVSLELSPSALLPLVTLLMVRSWLIYFGLFPFGEKRAR